MLAKRDDHTTFKIFTFVVQNSSCKQQPHFLCSLWHKSWLPNIGKKVRWIWFIPRCSNLETKGALETFHQIFYRRGWGGMWPGMWLIDFSGSCRFMCCFLVLLLGHWVMIPHVHPGIPSVDPQDGTTRSTKVWYHCCLDQRKWELFRNESQSFKRKKRPEYSFCHLIRMEFLCHKYANKCDKYLKYRVAPCVCVCVCWCHPLALQ